MALRVVDSSFVPWCCNARTTNHLGDDGVAALTLALAQASATGSPPVNAATDAGGPCCELPVCSTL
jgi:hypothetical protein